MARVAYVKGDVLLGDKDDSFENCEDMADGEPMIIMNPNEYTIEDTEIATTEDKIVTRK